jgi:ubiquinone/menaquinone biosynthesis C-methylase UbiE
MDDDEEMTKLNLGCGRAPLEGWINIDQFSYPKVDLILDLNEGKLPFEDNSITMINADCVFEHLLHWETLLYECYRVLVPSGTIRIRVPYRTKTLQPFVLRFFDKNTMEPFLVENKASSSLEFKSIFSKSRFMIERSLPFKYQLEKYFNIPKAKLITLGFRKKTLIWILEKG